MNICTNIAAPAAYGTVIKQVVNEPKNTKTRPGKTALDACLVISSFNGSFGQMVSPCSFTQLSLSNILRYIFVIWVYTFQSHMQPLIFIKESLHENRGERTRWGGREGAIFTPILTHSMQHFRCILKSSKVSY
jgi:hypothetical protein